MVKKLVLLIILIQSIPTIQAMPKGLPNCGASCYLSSVTQCLYNINELTKLFLEISRIAQPAPSLTAAQRFPYAYQQLLLRLQTPRVLQLGDPILQYYQQTSMDMVGDLTGQAANMQEDAQEFFSAAFNALKNTSESINDFISNNLFGFFKTIKTTFPIAEGPPIVSYKNADPEYYLSIPIKTPGIGQNLTTLQECLNEYFKEEIFDDPESYVVYQGDDPLYEAYLGKKIPNAIRKTLLVNVPNLLILSLNRFEIIDDYGQRTKIKHVVDIPNQLNMSAFVKETFDSESYDYDLLNIVIHSGEAEGGHYVAYVKDTNQWFLCNDSQIDPTTFEHMNNPDNRFNIKTGAYIVFYKKRDSSELSSSDFSSPSEENLKQELTNLSNTLNLLEKKLQKKQ